MKRSRASYRRIIYFLLIILLIIFGLSSRRFTDYLPQFISLHFGDTCWTATLYFFLRFIFIRKSLTIIFIASLFISFLVEISQLYQAEWINTIRATTLGALVLGSGFLWIDFVRYTVGAIIAFVVDKFWIYKV